MTILQTIERKHYVVTEHDVEQLAAAHLEADTLTKRSDGQYLRILIAATQAQFGNGKDKRRKLTPADATAHADFVAATHTKFYVAVLRGITTPEVADEDGLGVDERRARAAIRAARAGFARSAASTVTAWIRAGGDVRALNVASVTKSELRQWAKAQSDPGTNPHARAFAVTVKRLLRDVALLAADDVDAARVALDDAISELHAAMAALEAPTVATDSGVFQGARGAKFRPRTAAA